MYKVPGVETWQKILLKFGVKAEWVLKIGGIWVKKVKAKKTGLIHIIFMENGMCPYFRPFFLVVLMTIILSFLPNLIGFCEAQALIQVTRSDFCRSIQNREPKDKVSGEVQMKPGQELYFWMEFMAGQPALDMLEKKGELPIFHYWRKGIVVTDKPNVGITQERWLETRSTIRSQVAEKGFFNWRTFSYKQNLEPVTYTILIQDGNGNAVTSVGSDKQLRKEIKVSF